MSRCLPRASLVNPLTVTQCRASRLSLSIPRPLFNGLSGALVQDAPLHPTLRQRVSIHRGAAFFAVNAHLATLPVHPAGAAASTLKMPVHKSSFLSDVFLFRRSAKFLPAATLHSKASPEGRGTCIGPRSDGCGGTFSRRLRAQSYPPCLRLFNVKPITSTCCASAAR